MFEPNKLPPNDTYIERYDQKWLDLGIKKTLDEVLDVSLRNKGQLTIVSSNSKTGKSTLIKRNFKDRKYLEFTGRELEGRDMYELIAEKARLSYELKSVQTIDAKFISSSKTDNQLINLKSLVIEYLKSTDTSIIIEDFHYLPIDEKKKLALELKSTIEEVKVVITAHPNNASELIKYNSDLNGRVGIIVIPKWRDEEIKQLFEKGFASCNSVVDESIIEYCVKKSIQSPHLAQNLGFEITNYFPNDITVDHVDICLRSLAITFEHSNLLESINKTPKGVVSIYQLLSGEDSTIINLITECLKVDPQQSEYTFEQLYNLAGDLLVDSKQINLDKIKRGVNNFVANINDLNFVETRNDILYIYDITLLFYLKYR